jgi:hypothetical protein
MKNLILLSFAALLVFSCKKYKDGPALSLSSKTSRLSGSWVLSKVIEDGVDKTGDYQTAYKNYNIIIEKSGTYSSSYSAFGFYNVNESGNWAFISNKEGVSFDPTSNNNGNWDLEIYRLTQKELWLYDNDFDGNKVEFHFVPK